MCVLGGMKYIDRFNSHLGGQIKKGRGNRELVGKGRRLPLNNNSEIALSVWSNKGNIIVWLSEFFFSHIKEN